MSIESLAQSYGASSTLAVSFKIKTVKTENQIITRAFRCFLVVSCNSDDLVPLKFAHFKEIAYKLNKFLRTFQTNASMLPFLVHVIEKILRELWNWFNLDSIVDGAVKSWSLIKIDVVDGSKQKWNVNLGFWCAITSKCWKRMVRKTTQRSQISKLRQKNFYVHLANLYATQILIQSQFAR